MTLSKIILMTLIFTVAPSAYSQCVERDGIVECSEFSYTVWYLKAGAKCSYRGDVAKARLGDIACIDNDGKKNSGKMYLTKAAHGFLPKGSAAMESREPQSADEEEVTDDFDILYLSAN